MSTDLDMTNSPCVDIDELIGQDIDGNIALKYLIASNREKRINVPSDLEHWRVREFRSRNLNIQEHLRIAAHHVLNAIGDHGLTVLLTDAADYIDSLSKEKVEQTEGT